MNQYKNIKYYRSWIRGNWYLIIPDFQKTIQLEDGCSTENIEQIIDNEICQFI